VAHYEVSWKVEGATRHGGKATSPWSGCRQRYVESIEASLVNQNALAEVTERRSRKVGARYAIAARERPVAARVPGSR
jgi:hypothetical protein